MIGPTLRTLRYLRPAQPFHRLWRLVRAPWFRSAFYLRERPSSLPDRFLPSPWPGDPAHGDQILGGVIRLIGREKAFSAPFDWQPTDQPMLWRFTLHYFEWLADLEATGKPEAGELARSAVLHWIESHRRIDGAAWHPYPLSLRLYAWLRHTPYLLAGADRVFRDAFAINLDRQARHLARALELDVGGNHLIKNLKALIACGACLKRHHAAGDRALSRLQTELERQILSDGCHYERSPAYHVQVLVDLMDIQALLSTDTDPAPEWLDEAIKRMTPVVGFFRHGDGGLALFNDGDVGDARLLSTLENRFHGLPAPHPVLQDGGYARLGGGGTTVIMDAGRCCPDDLPAHAHADTLSFEMSDGVHRIVVNSGTYAYQDPAWRNRLRGTPAHSTVSVGDEDSAEVHGVFRLGRRPRTVDLARDVDHRGTTLRGSHDGYAHLGVRHVRTVTLSPDGNLLQGEDLFEGNPPNDAPMIARFHLSPGIQAEANGSVKLTLPNGTAWRFESEDDISLRPSVYAPRFYEMHETVQIVIQKTTGSITWRFIREPS